MIIFILGLVALVGCGVCVYLDMKTEATSKILAIVAAACIGLSAVAVIPQIAVWASTANQVVEHQAEYRDLKAYSEAMADSKDEYARAMLYNEVCEWNATIEAADDMCNNIWVGSYFPNRYKDCEKIEFNLSRGEKN